MPTYTVTLSLDARHEPALRKLLELAFGSTVAMLAKVEKVPSTNDRRGA